MGTPAPHPQKGCSHQCRLGTSGTESFATTDIGVSVASNAKTKTTFKRIEDQGLILRDHLECAHRECGIVRCAHIIVSKVIQPLNTQQAPLLNPMAIIEGV